MRRNFLTLRPPADAEGDGRPDALNQQPMADVLPDLLQPGLRVVFCGTAAGTASARARAYYAGPGNAFWQALHLTGLTPVELVPAEFGRLPEYGIGLTDICKTSSGSDVEVGVVEFDVAGLQEKIAAAEPGHLAFNGKNAARGALERDVAYGPQDEQVGGAQVWVLPSTSGRARRFWKIEPWQELALACGAEPDSL
jgi:TDG/mug DNA glycosylase family protein